MLEVEFERLQLNKVLVVLRSCGSQWQKSFIKSLEQGRAVVDLADPIVREQALSYPEGFILSLAKPALLYNLQRAPELLPLLAQAEAPQGSFVAVTEQSHYLLDRIEELGSAEGEASGDADDAVGDDELWAKLAIVELPLMAGERVPFVPDGEGSSGRSARKAKNVLESIVLGSLRRQEGSGDKQYYTSFIKSMVRQQIMEQTTVSDDIKFYRFLGMAASMTGTVVNYARLASTVGITAPTAKQWLQFLAGTGLVYLLQPLEGVVGKRLVKAPKLYFRDTGMVVALLQLTDAASVMQSVYYKNLFENYVVNEIRESYLEQGVEPKLLFYKDSNYKEISLIMEVEGRLYPVAITKDEFKTSKLYKDFQILNSYAEEHGLELGSGCVIGMGKPEAFLEHGICYAAAEKL
ncbi:MAG: DUF4143 domain-containing protein [Phascolarctobacterium sp.]|nr:DUF4143 domain-containing protein [Phascolarctobacterium sp.]